MALMVMDGGSVLRTITSLKVWDGTRLVSALRAKVMDSDGVTLRTVATFSPPMTASASDVDGTSYSNLTTSVTTIPTTATPSGGTGPYTYAWTLLSYSAGTAPTIGTASNASTTFTQTGVAPDTTETAEFRCTVTDAFGQQAAVDVGATFNVYSI